MKVKKFREVLNCQAARQYKSPAISKVLKTSDAKLCPMLVPLPSTRHSAQCVRVEAVLYLHFKLY